MSTTKVPSKVVSLICFLKFQEHLVTERKEKPVSMNAFELISRSPGFSLDNLFEKQKVHILYGCIVIIIYF